MTLTEEERATRTERAKKEVHFQIDDLTATLPKPERKVGNNTPLRRHSLAALTKEGMVPTCDPVETTVTVQVENNDGELEDQEKEVSLERTYAEFLATMTPEAFEKMRYPVTLDLIEEDLKGKIEDLAVLYGMRAEGPGCLFTPMTDEGKDLWAKQANTVINGTTFMKMASEDVDTLFAEFKLRSIALAAATLQIQDIHRIASGVDHNMNEFYRWIHHVGEGARSAIEEATGVSLNEAQQELIHQVQSKEVEIDEMKKTIDVQEKEVHTLNTVTRYQETVMRDHEKTIEGLRAQLASTTKGTNFASLSNVNRQQEATIKDLELNYKDVDKERTDTDKWDELTMAKCDSYQDFKNQFVRLAASLQKPQADWKKEFDRRLTPQLQRNLAVHLVDPTVSFTTLTTLAQNVDYINRRASKSQKEAQTKKSTAGNGQRNGGGYRGGYSSRDGRKVGTSSFTSTGGTKTLPPKPTGAEFERLMSQGRCLTCRKRGHRAYECPNDPRVPEHKRYKGNKDASNMSRIAALRAKFVDDPEESQITEVENDESENE